jgi:hypothetical protein
MKVYKYISVKLILRRVSCKGLCGKQNMKAQLGAVGFYFFEAVVLKSSGYLSEMVMFG